MQTLTKILVDLGLDGRVLTDENLTHLFPSQNQRRYNLVNRALKSHELIRISRGVYAVSARPGGPNVHAFVVAQTLDPGSFVSAESALSYHAWIPEGVRSTVSISPGVKRRQINAPVYDNFDFRPLSTRRGYFLELVQRQEMAGQVAFIATPVRALMDMAYLNKLDWQGLEWLTESYRIDLALLGTITEREISTLQQVYTQKRVLRFLESLSTDLSLAFSTGPSTALSIRAVND